MAWQADATIAPSAPPQNKDTVLRRPRIALVQAGLGAGGTEKVMAQLATRLDRDGYVVTMLAIHGTSDTAYHPLPAGVALRTMASELGESAANRTLRRIAWLRRTLRGQDLALSCLTKINVQTALATAGTDTRWIASERNNFRQQRMNPLWRAAMPLTLSRADAVVMQTKAARDALPGWAVRNARVVANPVATAVLTTTKAPSSDLIAVGRLNDQKGYDVLLHALRIARDRGHRLPLTIYGVGKQEAKLKALVQSLDLGCQVRFAGRSDVPLGWTASPGIFVLSSRFEGFPNVLIEAMASGFAVLSTRCDWGPGEIITDGTDGMLVPVGDPAAMAEGLIRLQSSPALRHRLANAAKSRAQDFDEAIIMGQWMQVIEDMLRERSGAASGQPAPT
ncbi:GalNAc-alpha-(1-_4)-GalNAc-alpha-(1-_3)-diNAcBac-PP-undecaprenol alpha-1,4-N-acetyl-D-galactosaminyltransferase [Rhodobacteraceae bacterium THAF1]|uniref:glycosyltransferase n=1 Tax=Palleronia sp. THAF1 TaxID=2587842 RepID=UPI000F4135C7|nr:glycosyltransferase [Palleronia sp. THAF1]QFU10327.1 GalNAc-alpha-(1->4)-GalNAc-alpha-(1->3)-diNAcBac-PP-undecaprenol alpha-1,4-N-acetyl-D-galactosaminyltransferase [Palleronia sp. THAF1]VDC31445.1 GalNAc-alpha-(1->4)-GalNAc-alpha-(1->3)-diNAcBac-PP-undecaprenol alpha-1,4-N-acetyl-D-galactosaminyltransferase [Rhodobacteraceae bacterium THAF1]